MNELTSRAAPPTPSERCEVEKLALLPSHAKSISAPTRVAGGVGGGVMRQCTKEKRSGRKSITYEYVFGEFGVFARHFGEIIDFN